MKTSKLFFAFSLLLAVCVSVSAQTGTKTSGPKTVSFKVWGNCEMCKDRIEKAVKEEGASSAVWDLKTKMLTVSYYASKTNADALGKKIASVGHDTEKYKASDDAYAKLPGCCHYERTK